MEQAEDSAKRTLVWLQEQERAWPWCTCMECQEVEPYRRAPARHDEDCECYHCWAGEDAGESLAGGGDGRKPKRR